MQEGTLTKKLNQFCNNRFAEIVERLIAVHAVAISKEPTYH
jgi:hypothetical protein